MKSKFIYLLPLLLLCVAACVKSKDPSLDPNYSYPLGNFTGKFTVIHKNSWTSKYDTASASIKLVLSTSIGFAVSGDTTIHAPSYGSFSENAVNMIFNDVTYPATGFPKKTHLAGLYAYTYDGMNLQITGNVADTLHYKYVLVKN
ncbi:MAG TPA: hypothetical protein VL490_00910 [Mucilaginibacter sp.]|jgi:hypothetical protein|nr:hypothetical protein [Mucilaginibacter sp.]